MKCICYRSARIVAMILVCVMSLSIFASAINVDAQPYYLSIARFSIQFDIPASGRSDIVGSVVSSSSDYSVNLTVELQQWKNSSWSTIKSWTTSGKGYVMIDENWYVVMGNKYRIHAAATVYDQNGKVLERATKNLATVTY